MATVKNYSEKDTAFAVDAYTKEPTRDTVEMIAEKLGKNARSVIAKLSALGVYVAQPKPTKRPPQVRKADLVADIEAKLGVEFVSLNKAGFGDLQTLLDAVS